MISHLDPGLVDTQFGILILKCFCLNRISVAVGNLQSLLWKVTESETCRLKRWGVM
jgi:hypothetical protein